MWFRRRKVDETRLEKAAELEVEAEQKLEEAYDLVDRVIRAAQQMQHNERINRLAPAIIAAAVRRHR